VLYLYPLTAPATPAPLWSCAMASRAHALSGGRINRKLLFREAPSVTQSGLLGVELSVCVSEIATVACGSIGAVTGRPNDLSVVAQGFLE